MFKDKEKIIALVNSLNQLEVKGQNNIAILYNILGFLQQELDSMNKGKDERKEET